jgi:hypothetical protein
MDGPFASVVDELYLPGHLHVTVSEVGTWPSGIHQLDCCPRRPSLNHPARKRTEHCRVRRQVKLHTPKSRPLTSKSARDQRASTACPVTHCAAAQRTGTR